MRAPFTGPFTRLVAQNATFSGGVLRFPCWSLASQQIMAGAFTPRLSQAPPAGLPFVRAAHWRMLLPDACFFVGSPDSSSSRYITGTLQVAIAGPFLSSLNFNSLRRIQAVVFLDSSSFTTRNLSKTIETRPGIRLYADQHLSPFFILEQHRPRCDPIPFRLKRSKKNEDIRTEGNDPRNPDGGSRGL